MAVYDLKTAAIVIVIRVLLYPVKANLQMNLKSKILSYSKSLLAVTNRFLFV